MIRSAGSSLVSGLMILSICGCSGDAPSLALPAVAPEADGVYHVYPGEDIQRAIEAAASDPDNKIVRVHAGTYRPSREGQAFVWLNSRHDGVTLEAEGDVTLTAENADLADPSAESFPAIVNHVMYFGDGVSENTIVRGFTLTGANHFVTTSEVPTVQPVVSGLQLQKGMFFYADGGAIKIFGRSYPTILEMKIIGNYSSPCGGGISIEHQGNSERAVTIRDCIFRDNRCQITGSAIDVLPGSAAEISNCLFVGNVANTGPNYVGGPENPYNEEHGSGALTAFPGAAVEVDRCTFTDNWNGADDKGMGNAYTNTIFWNNTRTGGISPAERYELDILDGGRVAGCFFGGQIEDLRETIDPARNTFDAPDPEFDAVFRPQAAIYADVGYRPLPAPAADGRQ